MKTAVFVEPGKVEARELPKATINNPQTPFYGSFGRVSVDQIVVVPRDFRS
ncbi:hypothetical protein S101258_00312 [Lactiplantibacillus plantarum subsp. plantarum]|uniref:Uncharacterized protein n=1 Tax=Lactiplantibacillus plantarum subsp. plantarum TaxID=337330 RepID=A0A2S3UA96_LACPN|nr:hypothetical protein S101258_00312 [Lactiplantibacillus plantarum subsp. plantarum]